MIVIVIVIVIVDQSSGPLHLLHSRRGNSASDQ